jgi:hypothetical protein
VSPWNIRVADLALGVLDQQLPLRPLDEDDEGDDGDCNDDDRNDQAGGERAGAAEFQSAGYALGRAATMPAKMISEMPLPIPRAVICSPSHIRNMVPPTSVMTVAIRKNQPGSVTMLVPDSRPTAMP